MNHKYYDINEKGLDYVVGDIHGCYDQLMLELSKFNFHFDNDRLFSVGDIIDRGPDSLKCLSLLDEPWFHMVLGNHECMMISAISYQRDIRHWLDNGGQWIFDVEDEEFRQALGKKLEELPYAMTIQTKNGTVGICHAQPPTPRWKDVEHPTNYDINNMTWGRDRIKKMIDHDIEGIDQTYHGHTVRNKVIELGNTMFIDTGIVFDGATTNTGEIFNGCLTVLPLDYGLTK